MNHSFVGCIDAFASLSPDSVAVTSAKNSITYARLSSLSRRLASYLKKQGVGAGDVVLCRACQSYEYLVAFSATLRISAVFLPVEHDCPPDFLNEIQSAHAPKIFFGNEDDRLSGARTISLTTIENTVEGEELFPPSPENKNTLAQILFTTGSTGKRKGVLIPSERFYRGEHIANYLGYDQQTKLYLFAPSNHVAFFILSSAVFSKGGEVVVAQNMLAVGDLLYAVENRKVNAFHATPSVANFWFSRLKDLFEEFSAQIKQFSLAGEKCPAPTQSVLLEALPTTRAFVLYGSTEMNMVSGYEFSKLGVKEGAIGRPLPDCSLYLEGERLCAKTPCAMLGYVGGENIANVVRTDDRAVEENGSFIVLGRLSDIILSGGHKIDPLEVEAAAKTYPAVADAVCVAKADAVLGSALKLFVQWQRSADEEGLKERLFSTLESYKVPRFCEGVREIKKNANGKTDRKFYKGE